MPLPTSESRMPRFLHVFTYDLLHDGCGGKSVNDVFTVATIPCEAFPATPRALGKFLRANGCKYDGRRLRWDQNSDFGPDHVELIDRRTGDPVGSVAMRDGG